MVVHTRVTDKNVWPYRGRQKNPEQRVGLPLVSRVTFENFTFKSKPETERKRLIKPCVK